jgi:hypothetical protein
VLGFITLDFDNEVCVESNKLVEINDSIILRKALMGDGFSEL